MHDERSSAAAHASLTLYSYWRSSAAYRVRIGLNLKGLDYQLQPVHLVKDGGQQHADAYRQLNPQQLLPTLLHDGQALTQSLAILEYIDETWSTPPLLPAEPHARARVRALAQLVACDIHPLGNLRVLQYLESRLQVAGDERLGWSRHWIEAGFGAFESMLAAQGPADDFCHGQQPGLADCCLLPQVYNARRFGVSLDAFPRIRRIEAACLALPAFDRARPENQPDAQI
ncbi:maleylacetoacetate isomerase [Pseudoxanthomonas dokdonensis]|uniref:Maleylacetoacetate isomerase n=1 Tax=Pseudoxanthomonas dokdonensis TaxID=344882 RepID=A0A0R0CVC7_9GAMM|nr:maleylacetoacetate isomerase [Pseudoxanthomonas dokdonensis]KRG69604.1 maleylacetoacetate isomerase [Pseudoxanthomonas dokdonensis]